MHALGKLKFSNTLARAALVLLVAAIVLAPFTCFFVSRVDAAPATASTTTDFGGINFSYYRKTFYAEGRHWIFYSDGTNMAWRTSTDGTTWSSANTTGTAADSPLFDIFYDGTYTHYIRYNAADTSGYYRRGAPQSDGTFTWSAAEQNTGLYTAKCNIAVDDGGHAWVTYESNDGKVYVARNDNVDGTWSTSAGFPYNPNSDTAYGYSTVVPLTTEKVYIIYVKNVAALVKGRLYDAGWGSEESVTASSIEDNTYCFSALAIDDDVYMAYLTDTDYKIKAKKRTYGATPAWGAETEIRDTNSAINAPTLSYDSNTGDIYCFYLCDPTDDHVFYRRYTGGSWEAEVDWNTEVDITSRAYLGSAYSADTYLGVVWLTSNGSPYNIRYDFITLSVPPAIVTNEATLVEETDAALNGNVTAVGATNITAQAFVWDTSSHAAPGGEPPGSYADNNTAYGSWGTGSFTHNITGLTEGEYYYYRAGARNDSGTWAYGNEANFLTKPDEPSGFAATAGDEQVSLVWTKGSGALNTVIVYKIGGAPDNVTDGTIAYNNTGSSYAHSGLTNGFTYYYRAWSWASESGLIQYSDTYDDDDATPQAYPSVSTGAAISLTTTSATLNGSVTDSGSSGIWERGFQYGTTVAYGTNWTELGVFGVASYSNGIAGLTAGATYHYRAMARNDVGWAYGSDVTFTTLGSASVATQAATNIANTAARLNAILTADGGEACQVRWGYDTHNCTAFADYGTITAWAGSYTSGQSPYLDLTGLNQGTTYYFRLQAKNSVGTATAVTELTFTTASSITAPTNLKAIPASSTATLSWTKGTGSNKTLVRYKAGAYPTDITDGTQAYFDTAASATVSGLTPGTTYYFSAWGETSGSYSTTYTTTLATTLPPASGGVTVPNMSAPSTAPGWYAVPNATAWGGFPLAELVNFNADAFKIQRNIMLFLVWIFLTVVFGVYVYRKSHNPFFGVVVSAVGLGIGGMMGIVSYWLVFADVIFAISVFVVGQRG